MKQNDREKAAAAVHESWAHWMNHLFGKCTSQPDGGMTIPKALVERWQRQIDTPYDALSGEEQQSDLVQADRILKTIEERT